MLNKLFFFAQFLFTGTFLLAQNVETQYSKNEYQFDELAPGTPMFTYPLLVQNNGDVLAVTSYKKQYLKYVYLDKNGEEKYAGKAEFAKYPKYSAYIYNFIVQNNLLIGYSIVQEEIEKKNHDVMYQFVIDMSDGHVLKEEIIDTRSLAKNKLGTLTVFPDHENKSVILFNCSRPEKNMFTFDISVPNDDNTMFTKTHLEYVNEKAKDLNLEINMVKFISKKVFLCTMIAYSKDLDYTVPLYILVDITRKKAIIGEFEFGKVYGARSYISYHPAQNKLVINHSIVSDVKSNYFTSTINRYYSFYTTDLDLSSMVLSSPKALPIQPVTSLLQKERKENEQVSFFPINFVMTKDGNQAAIMADGFQGWASGCYMDPFSYYYKEPVCTFLNPHTVGCFSTKGNTDAGLFFKDEVNDYSDDFFDLMTSNQGYYFITEKGFDEPSSPENKYTHYYHYVHVSENGTISQKTLNQNPQNSIENILFKSKTSPFRNPPYMDGYNSHYNRNNNRNIACYRLKNKENEKFRYVWLIFN